LKIDPYIYIVWDKKGIALDGLGRYDEAIKAYYEALKIYPQDAEARTNKEIALKNLGRNDEANKTFDEPSNLQKAPGFEIIFAIVGLVMMPHLLRRKG
jgi:tetratricopeptide (TPR) repeat protein